MAVDRQIRSAEDVLAICKERGLRVRIEPGPPPQPILTRPAAVAKSAVTLALKGALRAWRIEIIELLSKGGA